MRPPRKSLTRRHGLAIAIAVVLAAWLAPVSQAGVVVEMSVQEGESGPAKGTETFRAQGERTRVDTLGPAGDAVSIIFRDQTMFFIDHAKKEARSLDKQTLDRLADQLREVMKQMEALPPAQREMMQKMMRGRLPGAGKPPEIRVEAGGEEQVGDYACKMQTIYSDDQKIQDLCLADSNVVAAAEEAMAAFSALGQFVGSLTEMARDMPFAKMVDGPFRHLGELKGFPVRTRSYDGQGRVTHTRTLQSVSREEVDASDFEVPTGYDLESMDKELQRGLR